MNVKTTHNSYELYCPSQWKCSQEKNLNNKQQRPKWTVNHRKKIVYFLCAVISKEKKISLKREKKSVCWMIDKQIGTWLIH